MFKMLILTNFKEKHKLHALGQLSTKHSAVSSIGKILVSSRIGSDMSKMLIFTNFKEKHKLHALGQLSTKYSTISSIGKILDSSRIGGNVQDVDLDCFHGSKHALRWYLFIVSKKGKI